MCNYLAVKAVVMKKTVLALLAVLLFSACAERDRFIQVTGYAQGGTYSVKVNLKGTSVSPEEVRDPGASASNRGKCPPTRPWRPSRPPAAWAF